VLDLKLIRLLGEDWPAPVVLRVLPVAQPAAGADFSFAVPGESSWGLVAVSATLVTSAAVANRVPVLRFTDGSNVYFRKPALAAITATLTTQVSWVPELGSDQTALSGGALTVPLPTVYLAPGNVIACSTTAIDVGDQWSNVVVTAVEVFNGHVERERAIADSIRDEAEAIAGLVMGEL
jgi:hypothetical protein